MLSSWRIRFLRCPAIRVCGLLVREMLLCLRGESLKRFDSYGGCDNFPPKRSVEIEIGEPVYVSSPS